jgi:hypothetical protein
LARLDPQVGVRGRVIEADVEEGPMVVGDDDCAVGLGSCPTEDHHRVASCQLVQRQEVIT